MSNGPNISPRCRSRPTRLRNYRPTDFPIRKKSASHLVRHGLRLDNYVAIESRFRCDLQQAAAEQDADVRVQLYAQANQVLMDDAVVLPFYYDRSYLLVRPWVHGLKVTPLGILSLDQVTVEA